MSVSLSLISPNVSLVSVCLKCLSMCACLFAVPATVDLECLSVSLRRCSHGIWELLLHADHYLSLPSSRPATLTILNIVPVTRLYPTAVTVVSSQVNTRLLPLLGNWLHIYTCNKHRYAIV